MSNFYLCDMCEKKFSVDDQSAVISPYCQCEVYKDVHPKHVMFDHHGFGGKRYDDPLEVCEHFAKRVKE